MLKNLSAQSRSKFTNHIISLRSLIIKLARPVILYAVALFIIYVGLFSIPPRQQDGNVFNEPIWLFHSLCLDAVFTPNYQETCRELSFQSLDHSAGAKYIIAALRWLTGVPPEAVQYYYHIGGPTYVAPDAEIRAAVMGGVALVSCLTLLLLFVILQKSFSYVVAFSGIVVVLLTPFWHLNLNTIAAEPFTLLATMFSWAGSLWLAKLLTATPRRPIWHILLVGLATGLALGYAIGVKPNGALAALGLGTILLYLFIRQWRDWFTFIWLGTVITIGLAVTVFLTNPLLWEGNFFERLQIYLNFRVVFQFNQFGGRLLGPIQSFPSAINASFQTPLYTFIPPEITIPFCLLGLWAGWRAYLGLYARLSYLFLITIGLANALLLPVEVSEYFNYYQLFTNLATTILIGIGFAFAIEFTYGSFRAGKLAFFTRNPMLWPLSNSARKYKRTALIPAAICLGVAGIIVLVVGAAYLTTGKDRKIWSDYVLAPTWDEKLTTLVKLAEIDPNQPVFSQLEAGPIPIEGGKPLLHEITELFDFYSKQGQASYLSTVAKAGGLIRKDSPDKNVTNLVDYQLKQNNTNSVLMLQTTATVPQNLQTITDPAKPLTLPFTFPAQGNYRLNVQGLSPTDGPILVGVRLDKEYVGLLNFDHQNNIQSRTSVVFKSPAGVHTVELYLPSIPEMANRNAQIFGVSLETADPFLICAGNPGGEATLCSDIGKPLNLNAQANQAQLTINAPASVMYNLKFQFANTTIPDQQLKLSLDGQPLQTLSVPVALVNRTEMSRIAFGPVHIEQGQHTLKLELISPAGQGALSLEKLVLEPVFPDMNLITPDKFSNSAGANVLTMTGGSQFQTPIALYGYNYNFYQLNLNGSTDSNQPFPVEVLLNNRPVGTVNLTSSTASNSLFVQLSNGGSYNLTLRAANQSASDKAFIYSVSLVKHAQLDLVAGAQFSWDKQFNSKMSSDLSILHLPQNVTVSKKLTLPLSSFYDVTLRVRNPKGTNAQVNLKLNVQDWADYPQTATVNGEWTEIHFKVFLGLNSSQVNLSWTGVTDLSSLDFMYMQTKRLTS